MLRVDHRSALDAAQQFHIGVLVRPAAYDQLAHVGNGIQGSLEGRGSWGQVALVVCDRFRLTDLQDAIDPGVALEPRVTRWSDAASDIRALRKAAKDGPLSVEAGSRALLIASLAAAQVKSDDAGNTRLVKRSTSNSSRDDVAAALTLAIGAFARYPATEAVASSGPIIV